MNTRTITAAALALVGIFASLSGDARPRPEGRGHGGGGAASFNGRDSWRRCQPRAITTTEYMRRFRPANYLTNNTGTWGQGGCGQSAQPVLFVSPAPLVSPINNYNTARAVNVGGGAQTAQTGIPLSAVASAPSYSVANNRRAANGLQTPKQISPELFQRSGNAAAEEYPSTVGDKIKNSNPVAPMAFTNANYSHLLEFPTLGLSKAWAYGEWIVIAGGAFFVGFSLLKFLRFWRLRKRKYITGGHQKLLPAAPVFCGNDPLFSNMR